MPQLVISIYDSFENPYYSGGGPVVVHEVAKRLIKKFDITVLTGNYPGAKNKSVDGVNYKYIGLPDSFSSLTSFQFLLPYQLTKNSFDVWLESFTPPYSTAFLPLFTKKPVIGLAHILSGEVMKSKYGLPFDIYERGGMRLYKKVITPTQQIAYAIHEYSPKTEVLVIPNGVYHKDFSAFKNTEPYILFLGRLDWRQKGLDLLVESYALIKDRVKQKLYIAGHGSNKEVDYLRNLIHVNGLDDRIILKGQVDGDGKQALLANADFVAIPSRYEGMSLVALEAFAFKKPVVSFDIPGFTWADKSVALKAKPFNLHDFAQLMIVLASESETRKRMGEKAMELVKDASWDTTAKQYEDCISACL